MMTFFSFQIFDIITVIFLLLSAILASIRGFFREVLSIIAWVGAVFAMLYGGPFIEPYLKDYIHYELLLTALSYGGTFILSLAFLSFISSQLGRITEGSSLTIIDRILGFGFGLLRGIVIIALLYLALIWVWPEDKHPLWIKNAKSFPLIQESGAFIKGLLPEMENKEQGYNADERTKLKKLFETIA